MIEIAGVSKSYGAHLAVNSLDLRVGQGEVFAFLGTNGAGKTTTIKMLVGLLLPDAGRLQLGPYDVVKQPLEASRLVGYVPDQPYLYDKLTGREFLQFVADIHAMSAVDRRDSLDEQIEIFRLQDFVDDLAESYSHGMKQRVVFAAALIHRPPVVILDEPMVGLDPLHMRVVKDRLRYLADHGTTIMMSTHTLSLAEEIADRLGVIKQGILQFAGTLDELRQRRLNDGASLEKAFLEMTA